MNIWQPAFAFRIVSAFVLLTTLVIGVPQLQAQFTSSVEGTVTDSSDAVIPEVDLQLKNIDTGVSFTGRSNNSGVFHFIQLPPGHYRLRATKAGFRPALQENIVLETGRAQSVPIKMEVGTITQEVTVQADVVPVETSNPKISAIVTNEYVQNIPISQRNIYNVIGLAPGITGFTNQTTGSDAFSTIVGVRASANGQRMGSNGFYVDGAAVNDMADGGGAKLTPNPDSVEEVRVTTNDYSAQWGKSSGILTQVVSKTGTNQIHGTLFWYHRDNALTARTYLQSTINPITHRAFLPFRRNEGGFSVGGPIKKDRTFIFATFDKLISSNSVSNLQSVETPDLVNLMQQRFPNNVSTGLVKKFTPAVAGFQSYQTVSDLTTGGCTGTNVIGLPCNLRVIGTGVFSATTIHNGLQWNIRADQLFRDGRDRLYGNTYHTGITDFSPGVRDLNGTKGFSAQGLSDQEYFAVNETHTFSPTMFNEASFSFYRTKNGAFCNNCNVPSISITGISGFGAGWAPAVFITHDFNWQDIVSLNRGTHAFKLGMSYAQDQEPLAFSGPLERPNFNFPTLFDFIQDSPLSEGGINFDPRTASTKIDNTRDFRFSYYSAFIQDDWKLRPNLTLNLGVRWEFNTNPIDKTDKLTQTFFGQGSTMIDRVRGLSVKPVKEFFTDLHKSYFAPRFGLAWDPTKTGKMSVRAGSGIFYDSYTTKVTFDRSQLNPPLFANITVRRDDPTGPQPIFAIATNTQSPFNFPLPGLAAGLNPAGGPIGGRASVAGTDPNLKFGYSINWFTGIQYAITSKWVVEANYLGARGNHLYTHIDRNRCAGCAVARINPYFSTFEYIDNAAFSIYHGGTFQVRHLFNAGFVMQAAYTIGKALDEMNSTGGGVSGAYGNVIDAYDLRRQYGLSDNDVPQRLSVSFVYNLPRPRVSSALVGGVLGGWEVSGILTMQKGEPQTIFDTSRDFNNDTTFYDVPDAPLSKFPSWNRSNYISGTFTKADFALPPINAATGLYLREGNIGRNTYRGPGFAQQDLALAKNTKLPWFTSEKANLQLRLQAYNAFNRVNATNWNTNISSGTFGRTTGSFIPRTLELIARIVF